MTIEQLSDYRNTTSSSQLLKISIVEGVV